jgi:hypothetical protein
VSGAGICPASEYLRLGLVMLLSSTPLAGPVLVVHVQLLNQPVVGWAGYRRWGFNLYCQSWCSLVTILELCGQGAGEQLSCRKGGQFYRPATPSLTEIIGVEMHLYHDRTGMVQRQYKTVCNGGYVKRRLIRTGRIVS